MKEGILMDNFITLAYMGTFVGMVAIVVLITEFTKDLIDKYLKQIPTKYVVFIYSLIVILGYQLMSGTFNKSQLLLTIINAILLCMTAQGGYEWVYKPVEQKNAAQNTIQTENATTDIKPNETYAEPVPEKPVEAVQSVQIQQKQTTEQK